MPAFKIAYQFADTPSIDNIPEEIRSLLSEVIRSYLDILGGRLYSVYVHGSASRGDWRARKSDLDTVAITKGLITNTEMASLVVRQHQLERGQGLVSKIEMRAVDWVWLTGKSDDSNNFNLKLACTGVCAWGAAIDFAALLPPMELVFGQYVDARRQRLAGYRKTTHLAVPGQEGRRLTRLYAKQAVRILNLMCALRGLPLQTHIPTQIADIKRLVPEAHDMIEDLEHMVSGDDNRPAKALAILEKTIRLYDTLSPVIVEGARCSAPRGR